MSLFDNNITPPLREALNFIISKIINDAHDEAIKEYHKCLINTPIESRSEFIKRIFEKRLRSHFDDIITFVERDGVKIESINLLNIRDHFDVVGSMLLLKGVEVCINIYAYSNEQKQIGDYKVPNLQFFSFISQSNIYEHI